MALIPPATARRPPRPDRAFCGTDWTPARTVRVEPFCDPEALRACCDDGAESRGCLALRLLDAHADPALLAELSGAPADDLDTVLRRIVPGLDAATLADLPPRRHDQLILPCPHHQKVKVAMPIDWTRPPCGNAPSLFRLQNLGWISRVDVDVAAQAITEFVDQLLGSASPGASIEHAWPDFAVSERLSAATRFLRAYVRPGAVVDRRAVHAAVAIVLTHTYLLATENCYASAHNHGVMQDLAIIDAMSWMSNLRDAAELTAMADTRLIDEQVSIAVASDGTHSENSPGYHLLMVELVSKLLASYHSRGLVPPARLRTTRDALLQTVVYMLQPNVTMPQFGDTPNADSARRLRLMIEGADAHAPVERRLRAELDYVLSRGARGSVPRDLDRVFPVGGYAALRERWTGGDLANAITGHLKCRHVSSVHYHPDDTGIEIYGYGQELIVDSGHNGYHDKRMNAYQYTVQAHNVLVVDDQPFGKRNKSSRILDHHFAPELSWVRALHENYEPLGIHGLVRTFALARPDAFVVVDALRADGAHVYEQHFHLHPKLTEVSLPRPGVAVASAPGGPSVMLIAPTPPQSIQPRRGDADGRAQSWYFPTEGVSEPSTDLVFHSSLPAGEHRLPVLILVLAPGASLEIPDVTATFERGDLVLSWTQGGRGRQARVPASSR